MYTVNDYKPPKPFFKMSIKDLLKYNKKCQRIDKYLLSGTRKTKGRKTRNKKNRKTRKRKKRTIRILSNNEKLKVII